MTGYRTANVQNVQQLLREEAKYCQKMLPDAIGTLKTGIQMFFAQAFYMLGILF